MSFFRKIFGGSPLKSAKIAEAQGNLQDALRFYAEADAWVEVTQIQLRLARLEGHPQERLNLLRSAALSADRLAHDAEPAKDARSALAKELIATARAQGIETEMDRRLLEEAVRVATAGQDFAVVGEALKSLGRMEEAAQAFAQAGQIEQMEGLYRQLESSRGSQSSLREAFDMYDLCLRSGARNEALKAIRRCVDLAPRERNYADLRASLESKLLPASTLTMLVEGRRLVVVGGFPADIGREAGCRMLLRDPSVSRTHARISRQPNIWMLGDRSSRNGTFLSGVRLASPLPLRERGAFRLGEHATFEFAEQGSLLEITAGSGLDRDTMFFLTDGPCTLPERLPGLRFFFQDGQGFIKPEGERLILNGQPCAVEILPIHGDEIALGSLRISISNELARF